MAFLSAIAPLLDGRWHDVESSWVAAARYDRDKHVLWIKTKQGYAYPWVENCDETEAWGFFRALSKGRWIWENAPPRGYRPRPAYYRGRTK